MFSLFLDANFVSSFEYKDNFVYFFLREKAIEKGKVGMHFKITNFLASKFCGIFGKKVWNVMLGFLLQCKDKGYHNSSYFSGAS